MSKAKAKKPAAPWVNRIVGYGEEAPDQLLANPLNWRIHPKPQQDALSGVLHDVGIVQNVIVNKTTGHMVDGHLRVSLALSEGQPTIPVTYVELSEADEAEVLATLDPLGAMAATDAAKLDELLRDVNSGSAAVQSLLAKIAKQGVDFDAEWQGMPEFESNEILDSALTCIVRFKTDEDLEAFSKLLGQKLVGKGKTFSAWYPPQDLDQLGRNIVFENES